jgi:hypothetical protein
MLKVFIFALVFGYTLSQIVVVSDPVTLAASIGNATIEIKLVGAPRFTITAMDGTSSRILFSKLYQTDTTTNFKNKLPGSNVVLSTIE